MAKSTRIVTHSEIGATDFTEVVPIKKPLDCGFFMGVILVSESHIARVYR